MTFNHFKLRCRKLFTSLSNPRCWPGLLYGVAPSVEHLSVLKSMQFDGVIDVGANRGQFSLACLLVQPEIPITAFEPIPSESNIFRKVHGKSAHIRLIETALGDKSGTSILHLSKRRDSSSILPIGRQQTTYFSGTEEVGTLKVNLQRLDDFQMHWPSKGDQLFKIDVQGYELQVLRGALETLKVCKYVYVECSQIPLYDGQALAPDVKAFLEEHNFVEHAVFNPSHRNSMLIQADYLFTRK